MNSIKKGISIGVTTFVAVSTVVALTAAEKTIFEYFTKKDKKEETGEEESEEEEESSKEREWFEK